MDTILKELVEFFREKLPRYLLDILALVSGPKSFLRDEIGEQCDLGKALTFLVLSLILVNCLFLPIVPPDFLTVAYGLALVSYTVVFLTLHLFAILLSWRLVRSSPPVTRIVAVYSYIASVALFFQVFWVWGNLFVIRAYPTMMQLSTELQSATDDRVEEIFASHPEIIEAGFWMVGVFGLYLLADLIWWLISWGAFRHVVGVGRWRSSAAFLISFFLGWVLFVFSIEFLSVMVPDPFTSATSPG